MRNYTAGERAIIALGVMVDLPHEAINKILSEDQARSGATTRLIPAGSYIMMREVYLKHVGVPKEVPGWVKKLFEHTISPKPLGKLKHEDINIDRMQLSTYSREANNAKTTDL